MINSIILLVLFLAGGLVGFTIYHFTLGKKQSGAQRKELEQTKAELDQYKSKVNSHFKDSAALMGQVASSYQALHNHMANQSQSLISDDNNAVFPLLNETLQESQDGSLLSTDNERKSTVEVDLEANSSELMGSSETSQLNDAESDVNNAKDDINADDKANERSVAHNDKKPDPS